MPAEFTIVASRRLGLYDCEFEIATVSGEVLRGETFEILERGTLWQWIVLGVSQGESFTTLSCITWIPESGAFVGETCHSRAMKAKDRKMFRSVLPPDLLT